MVDNLTVKKIKMLQTDNGQEWWNPNFYKFLEDNGIERRLTTPYTPQQSGVAEKKNGTFDEMARCMMREAKTLSIFWDEAINTANYIRNRYSTKPLNGKTPYEL